MAPASIALSTSAMVRMIIARDDFLHVQKNTFSPVSMLACWKCTDLFDKRRENVLGVLPIQILVVNRFQLPISLYPQVKSMAVLGHVDDCERRCLGVHQPQGFLGARDLLDGSIRRLEAQNKLRIAQG